MDEKKIILINEPRPILPILQVKSRLISLSPPEQPKPVPPGKVRLADGSIVDRDKVVYHLKESTIDKNYLGAIDGTVYYRDIKGSLRTVRRPSKAERKAQKAALRKMVAERNAKNNNEQTGE